MSGRAPRSRGASARNRRFVLIASRFHEPIARSLVRGATDTLTRHGAARRQIALCWVPGAFELPVVAARLARRRPRPDAIIALGALVRGQTSQYTVLAQAAAQGLTQVSVTSGVPVTFGLIVAESLAQARARAGGSQGNRGEEAALAALAVLKLFDGLDRHR